LLNQLVDPTSNISQIGAGGADLLAHFHLDWRRLSASPQRRGCRRERPPLAWRHSSALTVVFRSRPSATARSGDDKGATESAINPHFGTARSIDLRLPRAALFHCQLHILKTTAPASTLSGKVRETPLLVIFMLACQGERQLGSRHGQRRR
jgi:hypothetical protein